jgi:hypothetical protein
MFELHDGAFGPIKQFPALDTAVRYLSDYRRQCKKEGKRIPTLYIVDTNATKSYELPNPSGKRKSSVFVRCPGS